MIPTATFIENNDKIIIVPKAAFRTNFILVIKKASAIKYIVKRK